MSASAPAGRWLHGPASDLLLGCGGWYFLVFALLCVQGDAIRAAGGAVWVPLLSLLVGTPHYGATLLRVYERREDRSAYRLFATHATLALLVAFAVGVHVPLVGSLLLTLYLTWSPWHYAGQNYGLAVMFLRRRGVSLAPRTKRVLYLTFFLSFLLTFLFTHGAERLSYFAPLSYTESSYYFVPLGLPQPYTGWLTYGVLAGYLASVGASAFLLARAAGSLRDLVPSALLMASQALWFVLPFAARYWRVAQGLPPLSVQYEAYYFLFIAMAHSVQYVWVTSSYAEASSGWAGLRPYLGKTLAAGAAVWVLPVIAFSPDLLGRVSFEAGLGMLVASMVNLHHFVLDGAIWKLRDGRVARILLRAQPAAAAAPIEPRGRGLWAWPVWATGAACAVLLFYGTVEGDVRLAAALERRDARATGEILDRLRWVGRDSAAGRVARADWLLEAGRGAEAEAEYHRSLALRPSAKVWFSLGKLRYEQRRLPEAVQAFEAALAIRPGEDAIHYFHGRALLDLGERERARAAFARALEIQPSRGIYRRMLERTEAP